MLRGNWGEKLALGIAYLVLLIIVVGAAAGLILDRYAAVHETYASYQKNAQQDRATASKSIASSCFDTDFTKFSGCLTEKIEGYYKQQATNEDLQAQQDMAFWAKWLFILGIGQAAIASIGIIYLARSVRQAATALKISSDSLHLDNRPWLDFDVKVSSDFSFNDTDVWPKGIGCDVTLTVNNFGKSPAFGIRSEILEVLPSEEWMNDFHFDKYRDKLLEDYSGGNRKGIAIFPAQKRECKNRILVSDKAVSRSPRMAKLDQSIEEISLFAWYIICVFYTSPTSKEVLETSSVYMLWQTNGKNEITNLKLKTGYKFQSVPKRRIRLREAGYKRAK